MQIENVKQMQNGYLVNDLICVPNCADNSDYKMIQKWIEDGGIVDQNDLLEKTKVAKISEIKSIRDQRNIAPITDFEAFVIDDEGNITQQESYFVFYTNRHQTNPASDPDSIITRAINLGSLPYFTKDLDGQKITVNLTSEIATLIRECIATRNNANYQISSRVETTIQSAATATIEEVKAIIFA